MDNLWRWRRQTALWLEQMLPQMNDPLTDWDGRWQSLVLAADWDRIGTNAILALAVHIYKLEELVALSRAITHIARLHTVWVCLQTTDEDGAVAANNMQRWWQLQPDDVAEFSQLVTSKSTPLAS